MTTIISRFRALSLVLPVLALLAGCRNPIGDGHDIRRASGVVVTDLQNATLMSTGPTGEWFGPLPALRVGEELPVRIFFIEADGSRFQLPLTGASHTLRVDFDPAGIVGYEGTLEQGVFRGVAAGETRMTVRIWHGSHADFSTSPREMVVLP